MVYNRILALHLHIKLVKDAEIWGCQQSDQKSQSSLKSFYSKVPRFCRTHIHNRCRFASLRSTRGSVLCYVNFVTVRIISHMPRYSELTITRIIYIYLPSETLLVKTIKKVHASRFPGLRLWTTQRSLQPKGCECSVAFFETNWFKFGTTATGRHII